MIVYEIFHNGRLPKEYVNMGLHSNILYSVLWILLLVLTHTTKSLTSLNSPTSDTVLSIGDSPYLAEDDVVVPDGVKLSIEAGVTVQFANQTQLIVEGTLLISGTQDDVVTLTVLPSDQNSHANQTVRLSNGENDYSGILEVQGDDGQWILVYDNRINSLASYQQWAYGLSKVVCRQLGFAVDQAVLYNSGSYYGYRWHNKYDCSGNESTIDNCTITNHNTYSYSVGVSCNSSNKDHWGGINFIGNASASVLENVRLEYPGIKSDQYGDRITSSGIIVLDKELPTLYNVLVMNSGFDGFQFMIHDESVHLSNLQATGCTGNGINITTSMSNARLEISDVEVLDNIGDGINVQTDSSNLDDISDSASEYPRKLYIKNWVDKTQTTQVFSTVEGEVLALYFINVPISSEIVIRDVENTDFPVLYTISGSTSNPPPIPLLVTTGRIMSIYFSSASRDSDDIVDMILYSGSPGSFGWHFDNVRSVGNGYAGLRLSETKLPQHLDFVETNDNDVGVEIQNVHSYTDITRSTISTNRGNGIYLDHTSGHLQISESSLSNNLGGIRQYDNFGAYRYYVPGSISRTIQVTDSEVAENELGFEVYTKITNELVYHNVTLTRNTKLATLTSHHRGGMSRFGLHGSLVYSNKGEFTLNYESGSYLAVTDSKFIENENQLFKAVDSFNRYTNKWVISGNNFTQNSGPEYILKLAWSYEKSEQMNITENRFENNTLDHYTCNHRRTVGDDTGIVHLDVKQNILFQENIFVNSNSKYDLYTPTAKQKEYSIDASYCYWGTDEQFWIPLRIYGSPIDNNLFEVKIYPFYSSQNRDGVSDRDANDVFVQQNTLGGILAGNVSLTDTNVEYKVIRNIQIVEGGHLYIGAGTNIAFDIGLGIQVEDMGRLDIDGQNGNEVNLYAANNYNCNSAVRFAESNNTNDGIVEIRINDTWHPVCYKYLYGALDVLCQSMGFEEQTSYDNRQFSSTQGWNVKQCSGDTLSSCEISLTDVCSSGMLYLECKMPTWEGVWFSASSKTSNIQHVSFSNGGYKYGYNDPRSHTDGSVLYFELYHHSIHDIEIINIDDNAEAGIIVVYNTLGISFDNILIKVNSYMDGFVVHDNTMSLTNVKIECIESSNCGRYGMTMGVRSIPTVTGIPFCSRSYYKIETEDTILLQIAFGDIQNGQECLVEVEVDQGYRIFITEMYSATYDCTDQVEVYEGDRNSTNLAHVRFHNKTTTYSWWTDGNKANLLFSYDNYYTRYCQHVSLVIATYQDDLPVHEHVYQLENSIIDGFSYGVYNDKHGSEMKVHNCVFQNIDSISLYLSDDNYVLDISNSTFTNAGDVIYASSSGNCFINVHNVDARGIGEFFNIRYSSGSITLSDSRITDASYVFYSYRSDFDVLALRASVFEEISAAVLWIQGYYQEIKKVEFIGNVVNNSARAINILDYGNDIIPSYVKISQNQFESCEMSVAVVLGKMVIFDNNTLKSNIFESRQGYDLVSMESGTTLQFSDNSLLSNLVKNCLFIGQKFSSVQISNNIFKNNTFSSYMLQLDMQSYAGEENAHVFRNLFLDNIGVLNVPLLYFGGVSGAAVKYNIFEGYGNSPLLVSSMQSLNPNFILDLTYNYWNLLTYIEILERVQISDSHIRASVVPFYSDSQLQHLVHSAINHTITEGRIDTNTTLTSHTEVTFEGQVVVPPTVEVIVEEGVVLTLSDNAKLLVYGYIRLEGTANSPICVQCPDHNCYIHLYSDIGQRQSVVDHVEFKGVSLVQISGQLPVLTNTLMNDTTSGIVVLGNEAYQPGEFEVSNLQITFCADNALTLLDTRFDVSLSSVSVSNIAGKGISIESALKGEELIIDGNTLVSTFSFCDADRNIKLLPKETRRHFYSERDTRNCIRIIETEPDHVIRVTIQTRYFRYEYNNQIIVQVFDGVTLNESRKLVEIYDVYVGKEKIDVQSTQSSIVVRLVAMERDIEYATFYSTPVKERDCTFETECSTWNNLELGLFSRGLTQWELYSWTQDDSYGDILQNDVNLPFSNDGHYYLLRGFPEWSNNYCYRHYNHLNDINLLESTHISPDEHLCSVSFYYFARSRSIRHDYGQRLRFQVYQKSATSQILLRDLSDSFPSGWTYVSVPLSTQFADNFTIVLLADTYIDCRMALGVDNIEFRSCSEESDLSITRITNSDITHAAGQAMTISNLDPNKHSLIWLENINIWQSGLSNTPIVDILLKSGQVLVRNNDISDNSGRALRVQFTSGNIDQKSEATISQNNLLNCSSAIHVINTGVNDAVLIFTQNTVQNMRGGDGNSTFEVINTRVQANDNVFYNNSGRYILDLGTEGEHNTIALPLVFTRNIIWFNTFVNPESKYCIVLNALDVSFTNNVINNPVSQYEVSTSVVDILNATLNFTSNWWGSGVEALVTGKIKDGRVTADLAYVDFLPILSAPPGFLGVQQSICPFGWTELNNECYIYKSESRSYNGADTGCRQEGSSLPYGEDIDVDFMAIRTLYVDLNGEELYSSVWARSTQIVGTSSELCYKFTFDRGSLTLNEEESDCLDKHPFICKKEPTIRCPNRCFGHGSCSYRTCNCYDGWEGEDCSVFHCRDVSECNGQGTCVGPNQCACDPGWNGRGCSSSRCPIYTSCGSCSEHDGCGWCDGSSSCEPGTGSGSDTSDCAAWFYYYCVTPSSSTSCSNEIAEFSCSRHCNSSSSEYNIGSCQDCMDTQHCYSNTSCSSWNEERCPSGIPNPDYDDDKRQDQIELFDNVELINPASRVLFACPYDSFSDDASQKEQLLMAESGELYGRETILVSNQADGVFHKILKEIDVEGFTFWVASRAKMEEVFKYADFKYSIDLSTLTVDPFEEVLPEDDLLTDIVSGNISVTQTVHDLSADTVYKCIGSVYSDGSNVHLTTSQFIVLPTTVGGNIEIDDVIIGVSSGGFLEDVDRISQTSFGDFAFTSLTQCSDGSLPSSLHLADASDMSCIGGSSVGLEYYTSDNGQSVSAGDTIIGRHSRSFLGIVVSKSEQGGYDYVEIIPVESVINGTAVAEVDPTELSTNKRRKRASFNYQFSRTFSESTGPFTSSLTPSLSINTNLDVKIYFNWYGKYKGFTVVFRGSIVASLVAEITASVEVSKTGPLKKLFSKKLANFAIPVFGVPVPGTVRIELFGQWSMKFGAEGSIRASATNTLTFVSSYASPGYNVPQSNVDNNLERLVTGSIRDVSAQVSYELTPQLQVQWPSTKISFSFFGDDDVPDPLKTEIGNVELQLESLEDFELYLTAILEAPIGVTGLLKACSTDCKDPYKPLYGEVYAHVRFGLSLQGFGLKGSISTQPTKIASQSICLSSEFSCCQCLQDDGSFVEGRLDPETKECLCECECEDGTKSLKKEGEECECDKCPDDSPKQFWAEIKCPCECNDKSVKAMEPDGSCDCSCLCEDGYTKDTISASGDCPCECECKNCQPSKIGRQGCECPDDVCPECEDGKQAQWSGCRCECPRNPCGKPPACASGRTGSNCDQPYCPGGCSGNGVCVKSSGCSSRCRCNRPWAGSKCERIDRRAWGDPHLLTLDGIDFDYFGIGQFWDCKSEANDFGIQVRYFYYKQTSLTGALAVKAGVSVVTLTTDSSAVLGDLPTVRVDGTPVDYSTGSGDYSVRLSEGSALLNIKKTDTTAAEDETSVALVSFQFSTVNEALGASLTLDVRYSPQMSRQYINVQSSITAAFKDKTSGLCGNLDGDTTNDLMGPDGTVYSDTDRFVESWKIDPMQRVGGGLMNSWSWTESNFHADDVVDISYTDPTFVPSYSIDGFGTAEVDLATQTCEQLDLEDSLLDGCIYDVLITNDTTMANQETLKTGCPNKCSGKGRCQNDTTCICIEGWSGPDCSSGSCGSCYNGNCESGLCHCNVGWEGEECDGQANCDSVDNCTSPNGVCLRTDICQCNGGFTGLKCDLIATCDGVNECSGNGVCINFDVCRCDTGWSGTNCSVPTCESLNFCSANGVCVEYDSCACNAGWKGTRCGNPDCSSRADCSGSGQCTAPNVCDCYNGFTGSSCEQSLSCPTLADCSENGVCNVDTTTSVLSCRCYTGYSGPTCSDISCNNVNYCNGNGACTSPDVCNCNFGYMGSDCSGFSCEGLSRCNGHGTCISHEACDCDVSWDGDDCSEPQCVNVADCSSQGTCIGPDECQCFEGYEGNDCSQQVGENVNAPVFTSTEYTSSVTSRAVLPVTLVTLEANDDDTGRNGEITYSIGASGISFDLSQHILIDSESGVVTLVKHIPATSLPSGKLSIAATVTDGGSPSKSDSSTIDLTVEFANENCPNIVSPQPGANVYINLPIDLNETIVQVEATDADVGENGELVYTITGTDSDKYVIEETTGEIKVQSELTAGSYSLDCVVSDKGDPPCKRSMSISAIATAASIPPQTIDTDPSTMVPNMETTAQATEAVTMTSKIETTYLETEAVTMTPEVETSTVDIFTIETTEQTAEDTTVQPRSTATMDDVTPAIELSTTREPENPTTDIETTTSGSNVETSTAAQIGETTFETTPDTVETTSASLIESEASTSSPESTTDGADASAGQSTAAISTTLSDITDEQNTPQADITSTEGEDSTLKSTTEPTAKTSTTTPLSTPFVGSVAMIAVTTVLAVLLVVGGTITTVVCVKQRNTIQSLQRPRAIETGQNRPRFYRPPYMRWT